LPVSSVVARKTSDISPSCEIPQDSSIFFGGSAAPPAPLPAVPPDPAVPFWPAEHAAVRAQATSAIIRRVMRPNLLQG